MCIQAPGLAGTIKISRRRFKMPKVGNTIDIKIRGKIFALGLMPLVQVAANLVY